MGFDVCSVQFAGTSVPCPGAASLDFGTLVWRGANAPVHRAALVVLSWHRGTDFRRVNGDISGAFVAE